MRRVLFAILLTFSTCAVVTHGILVYQLTSAQYFIAEEESSGNEHQVKKAKDISKETITGALALLQQWRQAKTFNPSTSRMFYFSKGFCNTPFNPPDKA
jgi:hypothetical protein